jgi:hypothetical protein
MSRFGILVSTRFSEHVIDDTGQLEPVSGQKANQVTKAATRRYLNIFLVLLRSCYIHASSREPDPESEECEGIERINKHHVFAGLDDFATLSMHWDVPPAGVLCYIHDFPGMYNNVSQVFPNNQIYNFCTKSTLAMELHIQSVCGLLSSMF